VKGNEEKINGGSRRKMGEIIRKERVVGIGSIF